MNITIDLTTEQSDALDSVVCKANESLGENDKPHTQESYLTRIVVSAVESYTRTAYDEAVRRLGENAAKLPYEARRALIAQVEKALA